jgi:hypothetical protein
MDVDEAAFECGEGGVTGRGGGRCFVPVFGRRCCCFDLLFDDGGGDGVDGFCFCCFRFAPPPLARPPPPNALVFLTPGSLTVEFYGNKVCPYCPELMDSRSLPIRRTRTCSI